jgi:hypothetical protein
MNLPRPSSKKFTRLIRKLVDGAGGNPAAQVEKSCSRRAFPKFLHLVDGNRFPDFYGAPNSAEMS